MPTRREDSFVWDRSGGWTARLREPRPVFSKARALLAALIAIAAITAAIGLSPTGSRVLEGVRESQVRAAQKITVAVLVVGRGALESGRPERYDIYRFDRSGRAVLCRSMVADYVAVGEIRGSSVLLSGADAGQTWIESFSIDRCEKSPSRLVTSPVPDSVRSPSGWMCASWSPDHRRIAATLLRVERVNRPVLTSSQRAITETWVGNSDGGGWRKIADGIGCGWLDDAHVLLGTASGLLNRILSSTYWPPVAPTITAAIDVETGEFAFFPHPEQLRAFASPDGSKIVAFPLTHDPMDMFRPARLVDSGTGIGRNLDPEMTVTSVPVVAWHADGSAFLLFHQALGSGISFYDATGHRTRMIDPPVDRVHMAAGWLDRSNIWVAGRNSMVIVHPDERVTSVRVGSASSVEVTPIGAKPGPPRGIEMMKASEVPLSTYTAAHVRLRVPVSWEVASLEGGATGPEPNRFLLLVHTPSSDSPAEEVAIGWTTTSAEAVIESVTHRERDPETGELIGPIVVNRSETTIDRHTFVALKMAEEMMLGSSSSFSEAGVLFVGRVGTKTYLIRASTWDPSLPMQMLLDSIRFDP